MYTLALRNPQYVELEKLLDEAGNIGSQNKYGNQIPLEARRGYALRIIAAFLEEGWPLGLAIAAAANAAWESGLNPEAVGDNGASIGLFQLNINGVGAGMTVNQRKDAETNIARILQETADRDDGTRRWNLSKDQWEYDESLLAAIARGATTAELAGLFSFHVERPFDLRGEQTSRADFTRALFPSIADLPHTDLTLEKPVEEIVKQIKKETLYYDTKWLAYIAIGYAVGSISLITYLLMTSKLRDQKWKDYMKQKGF